MADTAGYMISTTRLFGSLNHKREEKQQPTIEDALLASKLGILVAVKTDKYANFKGDFVELDDSQLNELPQVITEYFNVDLKNEISSMLVEPGASLPEINATQKNSEAKPRLGFFKRLGSFFKRKS